MSLELADAGVVTWFEGPTASGRLARAGGGRLELLQLEPQRATPFRVVAGVEWGDGVVCLDWRAWSDGRGGGALTVAHADGTVALTGGEELGTTLARVAVGGAVRCMEHSPHAAGRVAVGGEGLAVVELEGGSVTAVGAAATWVSWNRGPAVPHILAATGESGETRVVDLRAQREAARVGAAGRCAAWRPGAPLQLAVGGDDGLRLWDLRAPREPLRAAETGRLAAVDWRGDGTALLWAAHEGRLGEWREEGGAGREWRRPHFAPALARYLPRLAPAFFAVSATGTLAVFAEGAAGALGRGSASRPLPDARVLRAGAAAATAVRALPAAAADAQLLTLLGAGRAPGERLTALGVEPAAVARETAAALAEPDAAAFFDGLAAPGAPPPAPELSRLLLLNAVLGEGVAAVDCALAAGRVFDAFAVALARPDEAPQLCARVRDKLLPRADADTARLLRALDGRFEAHEWRHLAAFATRRLHGEARRAALADMLGRVRGRDAALLAAFAGDPHRALREAAAARPPGAAALLALADLALRLDPALLPAHEAHAAAALLLEGGRTPDALALLSPDSWAALRTLLGAAPPPRRHFAFAPTPTPAPAPLPPPLAPAPTPAVVAGVPRRPAASAVPRPPPPRPVAPPAAYDVARLAEVRDFLRKTPAFIAEIEADPPRAAALRQSMAALERLLAARALSPRAFDLLHALVALLAEDRVADAARLLLPPPPSDLAPFTPALQRLLNAL